MSQELQVKRDDPVTIFKSQVSKNEHEFRAALPAHIPTERFARVFATAVVNNPALLEADRRSLFQSAMKAAEDGLLPDGREGALVIYSTKVKDAAGKDIWIKKVQWMPMIAGILKKVRNSGELISISAHVVYSNDEFSYELGDNERVTHRPALDKRGVPRLLYAIAKLKDGGVYREIMTVEDVEKVRDVSRAKDSGPWVSFWDEMARKTVLRRLSKRLPMSSDLDDLMRRDDGHYDFNGGLEQPKQRLTLEGKLNALAGDGNGETPPHDPETGEIMSPDLHGMKMAEALNDPTGEEAGRQLKEKLDERAGIRPGQTVEEANANGQLQKLLAEARAKAAEGAKKFKPWVDKLSAPDFERLGPHFAALHKVANAADEMGK